MASGAPGLALTAGLLWLGRGCFYVEQEPWTRSRRPLLIAAGGVVGSLLVACTAVWIGSPANTPPRTIAGASLDLLSWRTAPIQFHDELAHLGVGIGLIGALMLFGVAAVLFRPLRPPPTLPSAAVRSVRNGEVE